MSSIDKLSIQGVRSFGSNAEDLQSLTFSSPVTLILGENGCGKTTVIECIKYALTGECPPGSDRGKSFVHDPKIFGMNESLAQIKMQIRDKCGARVSICRTMKVSSKRGKVSFETMDSTINFLTDAGHVKSENQDSLSGRTMDIDLAISDFMGVSKAIINNVLFCHQEDSSWPLDEAKKLKEKFDAIFGITEYNKALDKTIKMRKEAMDELKLMETGMKHVAYLKQEMEVKTLGLQKAQQKCESIKAQCSACEEEMKPIETRLREILDIENEIGKHQAQKVEMDTKHKNCKEQISTISRKIKTHFKGSLVELDLEIGNFDQRMSEMRHKRSETEEQLSKLKKSHAEMHQTQTAQDKKCCLAKQRHQNEQACKTQLVKRVKDFCSELQISVPGDLMAEPENLVDLLHDIEEVIMSKLCEITEVSNHNDSADKARQSKIDELRIDLTKSEQGVTAQEKQKEASKRESETLEVKVQQIETNMHELKLLEKQIADADAIYERTSKNFNQENFREIIGGKKTSIAQKQALFKKLDEQLTFLGSMAKLVAEMNLKEKELEKKNQEIHRVRSRHSDNFGKFFKEPISSNYRRSLQGAYDKVRREIQDLNEQANAQKLREQSYEIKRKNLMADIARMEKELKEGEELIFQKCRSTPYDELLDRSKLAISKLQLEHGAHKSAEALYKKYIQKIDEEPCCPLCHHNMSGDEACDLTTELSDEIQKLPDNISRSEKALKAEQLKYESLLQIKPSILKVSELKEILPKKKEELSEIEILLGESVSEYETLIALIGEPTQNMDLANSMLGDMTLLDEALKDSVRVKKDLDQLKSKLPDSYDSSVSMDALQAEKSRVSKDLETERKELESTQHTFEQHVDALNRLREVKNGLKDKQLKLQEGLQSLPQLKERQTELTQRLVTITTEISELKAKIQPLKQKLRAAIDEKERLKEAERTKLSQLNAKYNSYKSTDQDIQRLHKEAQAFAKLDLQNEIGKLEDSIRATKEQLKQLEAEINAKTVHLESVKTECLNQQTVERDLRDNRELMQLQDKETQLRESCETLAKKLGNLDLRKVYREKVDLTKRRDAGTVRKGELLGQLGEIQSQVERLQREIDEPRFREAVKNFRKGNFDMFITRCSIEDLAHHRFALEWSLIQFHAEKMEKINRLIREYWRMIYRGNDIDYIQVKTDEVNTDVSANCRKTYNYRVVQSKNNTEIEMRGRCSAGQRVLASLIIRMALAETFSSNCGVLALDEPTTNLDRVNITSLCDALNLIVEERQSQSNFMLIIITHDENFINSLCKITNYHRVFRNDECKSVIRKVQIG
ncbi:LOW QUALITY PROTEIN: DNA repair protein RAD50 [Drosophila obscura]|uniref:LOW QUALITY PROTEIN: DNA repair protein RAD50 n=1 Tax=Drosophila obscura TaxID=7282 RepID=UPI001BB15B6D|nr:LOW QUALITY PROTEIN: DNA repair protein RAD50 [Drosophila obscura]